MNDLMYELSSMKFLEPDDGEEKVTAACDKLRDDITKAFREIEDLAI
jgi:hypothetical protein